MTIAENKFDRKKDGDESITLETTHKQTISKQTYRKKKEQEL